MATEQPSYYAVIPANVRYDKDLKANEKLIYGEVTCLSQSTGRCFASNNYFAELYGVSKETVSRWISNLSHKGYIEIVLVYKKGTKQIINRYIQICQYPIDEKINTPIDENVKGNTTSFNTTSNNKDSTNETHINQPKDINQELTLDDKPESVDVNVWFSFLKYRKAKKSKLTELAMKGIERESVKANITLEEVLVMIMERSWTGFKAEWVNKQISNQKNNQPQVRWLGSNE